MVYAKAFVPLESDPEIFTQLACRLGLTSSCAFEEVFDLDDIDPLHNVLAYILLFPTSESFEQDLSLKRHDEPTEDVIWYKQTINNACGLYAILHALSNGCIRSLISISPYCSLQVLSLQHIRTRLFCSFTDCQTNC